MKTNYNETCRKDEVIIIIAIKDCFVFKRKKKGRLFIENKEQKKQ